MAFGDGKVAGDLGMRKSKIREMCKF